jgi:hypothetical protein
MFSTDHVTQVLAAALDAEEAAAAELAALTPAMAA